MLTLVGCATLTAAGSIVLLVFASLVTLPVPSRSLVAAATVTCAASLMEAFVGYARRATSIGRIVSEVGQAVAIAAAGWTAFSAFWASGYGSLLTPGRKPLLNGGAVLGCTAAAVVYGRLRPASRSQTAVPFASALVMLHLHLLVTPEIDTPKLAPMALASAAIALVALVMDVLAQRALHAPPTGGQPPGYFRRVRGTEDMVLASLLVNLVWTLCTLGKWTYAEAPSWGFVAISAALSATELGLRTALAATPSQARASREYYVQSLAGYYQRLAYWLSLLGAWRALWPDDAIDTTTYSWRRLSDAQRADTLRRAFRKREKHFFSLIGAFSLWGVTSAAAGRTLASAVAVAMVLLVIFKTAVASLFGEPLVLAGVIGLTGSAALIGLLVRFVSDESLQ